MNNAFVLFVDEVEKVNKLVESGVVINDTFVPVLPLTMPAKRVIISNIPPFISDDVLVRELSRYGKIMLAIRKLPSGCKSPLLRHIVSHIRQVQMILNNRDEELNLTFKVNCDKFDDVVFVTSESSKCFGCGNEGHIIKDCPNKITAGGGRTQSQGQAEPTTEPQNQNHQQESDEAD